MNSHAEIYLLLQTFQEGYIHRDVTQADKFMELFTVDTEVIGTNDVRPGVDEWHMDRASARDLVEGDWHGWGDLRLDLDTMSIPSRGDVGWVAAPATVTKTIGAENNSHGVLPQSDDHSSCGDEEHQHNRGGHRRRRRTGRAPPHPRR